MLDYVAEFGREAGEGVEGTQGAQDCGNLHDWVTQEWRPDFDGDELVSILMLKWTVIYQWWCQLSNIERGCIRQAVRTGTSFLANTGLTYQLDPSTYSASLIL